MRPAARRRPRLLLVLCLATASLSVLAPAGCAGKTSTRRGLPRPLELPDDPPAAIHLDDPQAALELAGPALGPRFEGLRPTLQRELARHLDGDAAGTIARAVDIEAPMDLVQLPDGEEILHVRLLEAEMARVTSILSTLPAEGDFGARRLGKPGRAGAEAGDEDAVLAWVDEKAGTLTFARSLRGVATGPELERAYGNHPLFVTVDGSQLDDRLPIARLRVEGRLEDFELRGTLREGEDPRQEVPLTEGAMTGLLAHPGLIAAVSSRYSKHRQVVDEQLDDLRRMVKRQNFFVQGILGDMVGKLAAVLRSWDGRFVAGIGPGGHLMLAYGAKDPKQSGRAVLVLVGTVIDNIKLARNFTSKVPKISIKRSAAQVGEDPIHRLIISGIKSEVPKSMHGLLDKDGRLRLAFAFPRHAGGGVITVGPRPVPTLQRWLEESAKAPSGSDTAEDYASLAVRVPPADLRRLAEVEDPSKLVGQLQGRGPHRLAVARFEGEREFVVRVTSREP